MLRAILLLAFVCSGGAGLIYELVWSRYLALFVGHSAEAQVLVIAMFLGGMSLGALVVGESSRRVRRPLRRYAAIELALAGVGLAFHTGFVLSTDFAYAAIFPALGAPITMAKWGIAGLMVFLPSILLGATFPLMAAGVIRAFPERPGGTIAALYFANSLGGAIGILLAGFLLVGALGLPGTSVSAAGLNLAAAAAAIVASRRLERGRAELEPSAEAEPGARPELASVPPGRGRALWRRRLAVSGLTAVASFIYEIGWIRMLSLVMGSATHSFELMLSAFILGLALGALAIRGQADRASDPLYLLGGIQWWMGLLALATLPLYIASFDWLGSLVTALPTTDAGYRIFNLARYGLALAIMLPATFLAGMTLPLITTSLLRAGAGERAIGWVYATNTAGAIAGVMAAGLFLMPALGLKGMLVAGAGLDMALGVVLLAASRRGLFAPGRPDPSAAGRPGPPPRAGEPAPSRSRRWMIPATAGLAAVALGGTAAGLHLDRALLTSGVFRYGRVNPETKPVLYYADGRTTSIGVHVEGLDTLVVLTSNGKPDASLTARWIRSARERLAPAPIRQQDESTQMLAALVTAMHAGGGRAAVIGHGSGISGHFLLTDPGVESLVTIEIEPRVVDASYVYYPANRNVFDDPRSLIVIADAKSYFAQAAEQYDLILSEPSNPWVSGTSSLFSREFYTRIRDYLTPDGVFGQWFHLYEMSDELITTILVALHGSFPAYRGYLVGDSDLLVVAAVAPELPVPDWSLLDDAGLREEISHVPPIRPHHLDGLKVFERDELDPLLGNRTDGNSDYRPVLDLGAERTRFLGTFADGFNGLIGDRFRIAAALGGWRVDPAPEPGLPILGLEPLVQRATGARARGLDAGAGGGAGAGGVSAPDADSGGGARRYGLLPPPRGADDARDWLLWLQAFLAAEETVHAGTAGFADSAFYAAIRGSLDAVEPPGVVREVVAFVEGLAAWDFPRASEAARALLDAREREDEREGGRAPEAGAPSLPSLLSVVPTGLLLDGSVVAALRVGDLELAERAYRRYAPDSGRIESDVRLALLRAHLERARAQPGAAIRSGRTSVSSASPSVGTLP